MPIPAVSQEAFWDTRAPDAQFPTPFELELFMQHVPPEALVLDVGCGYGRTLTELRQAGYLRLLGCDISQEMLRRAQAEHGLLNLAHIGARELPYPDNSVDAVLLVAVLTCIVQDADQYALLDEIARVLRPGGWLYVNDFMLNSDARNLARYDRFEPKHGVYGAFELDGGGVVRHHTLVHLRELLAGFVPLELQETVYTTMNGNHSNGLYYLGKQRG